METPWYQSAWFWIVAVIASVIWGPGLFFNDSTPPSSNSNCNANYSGCLKRNAGDYDCSGGSGNGPNYTGKVRVIGHDEYGLDRDGDGWGCE